MGRYGIGARVKHPSGETGEVIDKRKGERCVKFDAVLDPAWYPKDYLTPVATNDNDAPSISPGVSASAYSAVDDKETSAWVPKVGDRVRMIKPATGGEFTEVLGTIRGKTTWVDGPHLVEFDEGAGFGHNGNGIADVVLTSGRGWFIHADCLEPVVAPETTSWAPALGDRVRILAGHPYFFGNEEVGIEASGEVTSTDNDAKGYRAKYGVTPDGRSFESTFKIEEIEPLPATPTTWAPVAGKFGKTRDGRKVGPMVWDGGKYPWSGVLGDSVPNFTETGRWWGEDADIDKDLVSEWIEPPAAEESTITLEVGAKYLTRGGEKVEILKLSGDEDWPFVHSANGYHAVSAKGKSCIGNDAHDIVSLVEPATPPAKFKVGDRVNWTRHRHCWQDITITEIKDSGYSPVLARHAESGIGAFPLEELELASDTLPIGSTVTFTASGKLSAINENGHYQVTFPGLPSGRNSFALPADYVTLAN